MEPRQYLKRFAANVVNRSGIARPTVEAVLPAVFDEIRYQLTEGNLCVPIEGFGTFAVIDIPERQYNYTYKEPHRIVTVPAHKKLKFNPTHNMQREVDAQRFDPTRRSFSRHPDDRPIRKRKDMQYRPMRDKVYVSQVKKDQDT